MSGITDGTHEYGHELDDQELMRRRDVCLALARTYPDWAHCPDLVEEYISEAEHQDGYAYWTDNFYEDDEIQSQKLFEDIQLYAANVVEAEVEALALGKVDMPSASKADRVPALIERMAQNVVEAIDADFETMDEAMWARLNGDPELAPYAAVWKAAVEAEASGEMTSCAFDRYMDWFSDAVRAPMLDQLAIEVLTKAIQITVLSATAELRYHYVPIRGWKEFVLDEDA